MRQKWGEKQCDRAEKTQLSMKLLYLIKCTLFIMYIFIKYKFLKGFSPLQKKERKKEIGHFEILAQVGKHQTAASYAAPNIYFKNQSR